MSSILYRAAELIFSGNPELYSIVFRSLQISIFSTITAGIIGIPVGVMLSVKPFRGRHEIISLMNTFMALPTVVVGFFVYSFISRSGPLGFLNLLFTPVGIVIGQSILILPLIISLVHGGLSQLDKEMTETMVTFGASKLHIILKTVSEGRVPVITALISGFGRVIGEVGVSMMLGGNIRWYTRTMTTAMTLETARGEHELVMALGLILLFVALAVSFTINRAANYERH